MVRFVGLGMILFTMLCALPAGEGGKKLISGPQPDSYVPSSFDCLIVKGSYRKVNEKGEFVDQPLEGRQRCLVCQFGLLPSVLVFVREPDPPREWGADEPLAHLLAQLDAACANHEEWYLKAGVIFLSPGADSSVSVAGKKDDKYLVAEAIKRDRLLAKLKLRSEKVKQAIVACYPSDGPPSFKLNPAAETTLVFYHKHKVLLSEAYAEGKLTREDADAFVAKVDAVIKGWKAKK